MKRRMRPEDKEDETTTASLHNSHFLSHPLRAARMTGDVERRWRRGGGHVERWRRGEVETWRGGDVERRRAGDVERRRAGEERWGGGGEDVERRWRRGVEVLRLPSSRGGGAAAARRSANDSPVGRQGDERERGGMTSSSSSVDFVGVKSLVDSKGIESLENDARRGAPAAPTRGANTRLGTAERDVGGHFRPAARCR
ncbi:unnamed protein product [Merluccius merluccius]